MTRSDKREQKPFIKVVYFDEQSASDYLDIAAGGKAKFTNEQMRDRTVDAHAQVAAKVAARLSWLPFVGGSAEAGASVDAAAVSRSYLSKTLSNTILTDYLEDAAEDNAVTKLREMTVFPAPGSIAHMKMFTPFMVIARTAEAGVDLGALDDALERAKGYYELVAVAADNSLRCVLRFNIRAFRNNYGLADLGKMDLVFHGIRVGRVREEDLTSSAEMSGPAEVKTKSGIDLLQQVQGNGAADDDLLEVYDIILAGIER